MKVILDVDGQSVDRGASAFAAGRLDHAAMSAIAGVRPAATRRS
jgi:hypothetical protein